MCHRSASRSCIAFVIVAAVAGCGDNGSDGRTPYVATSNTSGAGGYVATSGTAAAAGLPATGGGTGAEDPDAGANPSSGGSGGTSGTSGTGGTGGNSGTGGGTTAPTMYVSGRHLYDRCGEQLVLRGVNEMIVWSGGQDGVPEYAEIAKTGANAVRIVWALNGSASAFDRAIANALAQDLIPMVEIHDATGDLSQVPAVVDYWTRSDIVSVLKKYEANLLLNIANEPGNGSVTRSAFESTYRDAITRIRNTGVRMPLIIDAPNWGQNIDVLQAAGPTLVAHDPLHNTMFSVHMWWSDANGTRVRSELQESVNMGLPLIVGEFASQAVCSGSFAYRILLSEAQRLQIGWLAWSWGSVNNSDCGNVFDMTNGGVYGNWEQAWGQEVAITDANSIRNTSVRPYSIVNGSCR